MTTTSALLIGQYHTASPDMCRELHAATGWDGTHLKWNIGRRRAWMIAGYTRGTPNHRRNGEPENYCELSETSDTAGSGGVLEVTVVPAYDLGYLLRRVGAPFSLQTGKDGRWYAYFGDGVNVGTAAGDTPEDAVALACIRSHPGRLVEAVEFTDTTNWEALATWCGGRPVPHGKIEKRFEVGFTCAREGDWVVVQLSGPLPPATCRTELWSPEQFTHTFEPTGDPA